MKCQMQDTFLVLKIFKSLILSWHRNMALLGGMRFVMTTAKIKTSERSMRNKSEHSTVRWIKSKQEYTESYLVACRL